MSPEWTGTHMLGLRRLSSSLWQIDPPALTMKYLTCAGVRANQMVYISVVGTGRSAPGSAVVVGLAAILPFGEQLGRRKYDACRGREATCTVRLGMPLYTIVQSGGGLVLRRQRPTGAKSSLPRAAGVHKDGHILPRP